MDDWDCDWVRGMRLEAPEPVLEEPGVPEEEEDDGW